MAGVVCSSIGNRLGNQMCVISAGLTFAKKYDKDFVITSPYHTNLNSPGYTEYNWITDRFKWVVFHETSDFIKIKEGKRQEIINTDKYSGCENVIFVGVFNSDKYYDREYVRKVFCNTDDDNQRISDKYGDLSGFVSLSVRRGDFLNYKSTFICPSKEWYEKCYKKYFDGRDLLITGDDLNWCRDNFDFGKGKMLFLEHEDAVETLKIKQICKNHIIPPSTYSWWSAYLSGDDSTVVVPDMWFTKSSGIDSEGKYLDNWIREKLI